MRIEHQRILAGRVEAGKCTALGRNHSNVIVMAGLGPVIHVLKDVDARPKAGHDAVLFD
jgi:hypothetical protein